jgi:pilus assembly protein CpaC
VKTLVRAGLACACVAFVLAGSAGAEAQGQRKGESAEDSDDIALAIGETRTISARDVKNYSEGVAGIIDVKLTSDASQFVLVGRKPGSTTLLLIKNDGSQQSISVNVFSRSPAVVEKELNQLLQGLNVKTRRIGSQIVIDGVVSSETDLKRVQQVAALYPGQVMSLAQLPSKGGAALPAPGGEVQRHLIRIDFFFVQYDRASSYAVGIAWPESIGAGAALEINYDLLAGTARTATASVTGQPLPRLDIASRRGWAKVLKQATVITNNDTQASYSSGGEQNFPVNTGLTIGLEKIQFGVNLTVLPSYDPASRELALKLGADIADLTSSVSGTTLPGRATSRLESNVTLKLGQCLVLSGIKTESLTQSVSGLPGLSDIPLIGLLFGTHGQSKIETEGAIFVMPSVVQAPSGPGAELVDLALKKFRDFDGDMTEARAYEKKPGTPLTIPR